MINNKSKPKRKRTRKRKRKTSRWALHRQRLRAGVIVLPVPVNGMVLAWLVSRAHWISAQAADAGDRQVLGQLVADGLSLSASKWDPP
jgi:hypothetical protein